MDRIDSSKHIRKRCLATNFKVLRRRGSCHNGWKDIGGILVNEVPEACREGSQRVVSFWNACSLTSPPSCSQEYRKPTPISHTFSRSVPASQSDPKWSSLSRVWLFATPWNSPSQNTGVGSLSLLQGDLPNPGIEPRSPTLQADSLPVIPSSEPKPECGSCQPSFTPQPLKQPLPSCLVFLPHSFLQDQPVFWKHRFHLRVNLNLWIISCRVLSIYVLSLAPVRGIPDLYSGGVLWL